METIFVVLPQHFDANTQLTQELIVGALPESTDLALLGAVSGPCFVCHAHTVVLVETAKLHRYTHGHELATMVWPDVDANRREALISGMHPACWDAAFGDDAGGHR